MSPSSRPVWPNRMPVFRVAGMAAAIFLGVLLMRAWCVWSATPLERFYIPTYIRLTIFGNFSLSALKHKDPTFQAVFVRDCLATAVSSGSFQIREIPVKPGVLAAWLRTNIYSRRTAAEVLRCPLIAFGFCFTGLVFVGARLDRKHDAAARDGRLIRGPRLVSRWRFNRLAQGDGLRFRLANPRNLLEWLRSDSGFDLVIRRDREAHHIQIAGDTGSGKSTLVRQIVHQIAARNEVAILFDPDREYIREFFRAERGDWVLNPKDDRCPYWPIGAECDDEAEATPIAIGLFPDEPTRQQFFLSHTRAIFSYLVGAYKPTVNELAYWMAHPEEIDKRVVGTEHAHTLTANASQQRAGILGSLNEAGKPLRMMPTQGEGRRVWTVREWSQQRQGWIFITSTPDTIDALRPIQSLWLDMLILKLQTSAPQPGQARVWIVLDELASLNALPQLHSALTKQRKSGNPIVLGLQGMSQLDALYGKKAETILSQAYTNIVLPGT